MGAVAASGIVLAATVLTGSSPATQTSAAAHARPQHALKSSMPAGHRVDARKAPVHPAASAAARAAARIESQRHPLAGPASLTRAAAATKSSTAASLGSAVSPTTTTANPVNAFRNSVVPTSGITSTVSEPSTDQSGKNIFQTSNWTAQYSHNNAASWTSLDPFTLFGAGFCCDQVTAYDPGRDQQFWLLQYNNHLVIANSAAGDLTGWCAYSFDPTNVGLPATSEFDYNDISIGTSNLFVTTNVFDSGGNFSDTAVLRLPLDAMTACAGFSYNYLLRNDLFTLKLVQGLTDIMYAASTAPNGSTGNTLRIVVWGDRFSTASTSDRPVTPFAYMVPNGGQNCGSENGQVNNWCQRTDSRLLGASRGNGRIYFSWNVNQGVSGRPFPYTREVTVQENSLGVLEQFDLFNTTLAYLYVSLAPDRRGHVGYVGTFGGGTGTTRYFPGILTGIVDDLAPNFPGDIAFPVLGAGGGCLNGDGLTRWGDYNTARGGYTGAGVWTVTSWVRTTNTAVGCGTAVPISLRSIVIGRTRDLPAYNRWYGV